MRTDRPGGAAPAGPGRPRRVLMAHPGAELYGADRVLAESVRALTARGWEVTVATGSDGPLRQVVEQTGARLVVRPFPVLRKANASPRGLLALAGDVPVTRRIATGLLREVDPDLVYVNTLTLPAWAAVARRHGARVLCHVHEAEHALPAPVRTALAAPLLAAHQVVANSRTTADLLRASVPGLAGRLQVVYNGVAGPPREPRPPRARLVGRVRLVVVGRLSARKGTDVAVRALGHLVRSGTDADLTVVGDVFGGNEAYATELRRLAGDTGLTDRVRFLGTLPQVWDALADSDIALVPSLGESFGNAAVEAMLAQRPVIASDTHGLREIVRDGENGLSFPVADATALAAAVGRAVNDWPEALARAERARAEAMARYSVARYATEIEAVASALIAPEPAAVAPGMPRAVPGAGR